MKTPVRYKEVGEDELGVGLMVVGAVDHVYCVEYDVGLVKVCRGGLVK